MPTRPFLISIRSTIINKLYNRRDIYKVLFNFGITLDDAAAIAIAVIIGATVVLRAYYNKHHHCEIDDSE